MYQDLNGNFDMDRHSCLAFKGKVLPCIHEGQYLDNSSIQAAAVPDINLECEEIIEDWDDIATYDVFSPVKNGCLHGYPSTHMQVVDDSERFYAMYDDQFPPPNSPVAGMEDVPILMLQRKYVNSLLQTWRDSSGCNDISADCLQVNPTLDDSDGLSLPSDDQSSSSQGSISDHEDSPRSSVQNDSSEEVAAEHRDSHTQAEQYAEPEQGFSTEHTFYSHSQNSSRSSSPSMLEAFPQSVLRLSFENLRSISPRIVRSPSPISSRSSSPRFFRSPSPLGDVQFGMRNLPLYDVSDGLVFYEDRYVFRSRSPVYSSDHEVPDVDMEFHNVVSQSDEFPTFQTFQQTRTRLNSCQDQVVPEFIEE